jgi:hypothetical protein
MRLWRSSGRAHSARYTKVPIWFAIAVEHVKSNERLAIKVV